MSFCNFSTKMAVFEEIFDKHGGFRRKFRFFEQFALNKTIIFVANLYSYCENGLLLSICVSVCLFRISSQTAGWINFRLSEKMPLTSPLKLVYISSRFDNPILHIFGVFYHFLHQCINWWLSD